MRLAQVMAAAAALSAASAALAAPASKPAPARALPDWSGVWENATGFLFAKPRGEPPNPPPLTPKYAAILAERAKAQAEGRPIGDATANCSWPGMPRVGISPYPSEFLFTPGRVTILYEYMSQVRRIYTDGRGHPADLEPSYNGHSIGHWEGDTLVVDTVGLRADRPIDQSALPHTDKLRIVERIHLVGPDRLDIDYTMTDPEVFTRPWKTTSHFVRHRDWSILDFDCAENNRNAPDASGVTVVRPSNKP
jgi:hypothetical protein